MDISIRFNVIDHSVSAGKTCHYSAHSTSRKFEIEISMLRNVCIAWLYRKRSTFISNAAEVQMLISSRNLWFLIVSGQSLPAPPMLCEARSYWMRGAFTMGVENMSLISISLRELNNSNSYQRGGPLCCSGASVTLQNTSKSQQRLPRYPRIFERFTDVNLPIVLCVCDVRVNDNTIERIWCAERITCQPKL